MKQITMYLVLLLCLFLQITSVAAQEVLYKSNSGQIQTAYLPPVVSAGQVKTHVSDLGTEVNNVLPNLELETVRLEKGRKFIVISEQNLNNNNVSGIPVIFKSVQKEYLAYDRPPANIVFKGKIEKTKGPRRFGKSGTVKVLLEKMTIDTITYPVEALISKIDNKNVYGNTIVASPCYLANLANTANDGVIHSTIKDPCGSDTCTTKTFAKPLVFAGAAALQLADLLLLPFAAAFKKGTDVNIPLNTYFEIKLDKDLYVLNL